MGGVLFFASCLVTYRGLPPGPNVGTQLRALRAKKAREDRETAIAGEPRRAALA